MEMDEDLVETLWADFKQSYINEIEERQSLEKYDLIDERIKKKPGNYLAEKLKCQAEYDEEISILECKRSRDDAAADLAFASKLEDYHRERHAYFSSLDKTRKIEDAFLKRRLKNAEYEESAWPIEAKQLAEKKAELIAFLEKIKDIASAEYNFELSERKNLSEK